MKKLFVLTLAAVMALGCSVMFVGCGKQQDATTRLTAEINPKVEFMLDANDKVLSVTGLNEEGELIISGEAFIGKSADEAISLFVEISTDAGYLVKGSASVSGNELNISVSGDAAKAQELYDEIKNKVDEKLTELDVVATVQQGVKETISYLRETLLEINPLLTDKDVANLTEEEIIAQINVIRREAKDIVGKAAKEAYYNARAYEIKLAESEQLKKIIDDVDNILAKALSTAYVNALDALNTARKAINDAYIANFVAEGCAYQTALDALLTKKQEVLKLKNEIASATDDAMKAEKEALLSAAQTALKTAESALASAKTAADAVVDGLMNTLNQAENAVDEAYNNLVQLLPEVKTSIENSAKKIDKAVNTAKKNAFNKFETAYGESLDGFKQKINAHKEGFGKAA